MAKHRYTPLSVSNEIDKLKIAAPLFFQELEQVFLDNIQNDYYQWDKSVFITSMRLFNGLDRHFPDMPSSMVTRGTITQHLLTTIVWAYTKSIYRFNPDMIKILTKTKINHINPLALIRLPEWCLYIDCNKSLTICNDINIIGFYVQVDNPVIDFDENYPYELKFMVLLDNGSIVFISMPLIDENLDNALKYLDSKRHEVMRDLKNIKWRRFESEDQRVAALKRDKEFLQKALPLVLYLCTEEPDIVFRDSKTVKHKSPKDNDKRKSIFIPQKIKHWNVGNEVIKTLNRQRNDIFARTSKEPHLRRAHWHGFWRGSKDEKVMSYKWLPPIFVNSLKANEQITS